MGTSNDTEAPVSVLAGPGVLIEDKAVAQLRAVARLAGCTRAVGMPDLHPGPGIPIGMVAASAGAIHPRLVGSDAGCGVTAAIATKVVAAGKRYRRIERATDRPASMFDDPMRALEAAWRDGPLGLASLPEAPEGFAAWVERVPWGASVAQSGAIPAALRQPEFGRALGTVGGGNHFIELSRVDEVSEADAMPGLVRGAHVVLAHSGSRGLGHALLRRWQAQALVDPDDVSTYLGELAGCCRFAQANRALLVWRLLEAVGCTRGDRIGGSLDLVHNDVRQGDHDDPWVHRKGAAPARTDELTITLGSRGTRSWILRGRGAPDHLCSVAHGAGRKMMRSEAKGRLRHRYRRAELTRSALGGEVICDRTELLWEEHPDVYKPIEPVVAAIEAAGVATRVASMVPLVTVKR